MRDYFRREPKLALWIDAAERLPHWCQAKANDWEHLLRAALELGVTIVATASSTQLGTYDALSKLLREAQSGVIFGAPDEQTVFRLPGIRSRSSGRIRLCSMRGDASLRLKFRSRKPYCKPVEVIEESLSFAKVSAQPEPSALLQL